MPYLGISYVVTFSQYSEVPGSDFVKIMYKWIDFVESFSGLDYALFPRIISEVVTKHRIQEFHLSLTQGTFFGFALQSKIFVGKNYNV